MLNEVSNILAGILQASGGLSDISIPGEKFA